MLTVTCVTQVPTSFCVAALYKFCWYLLIGRYRDGVLAGGLFAVISAYCFLLPEEPLY